MTNPTELAVLPHLTAPELDELGLALTHRLAMMHSTLNDRTVPTELHDDWRERYAICLSLATAVAEARLSLSPLHPSCQACNMARRVGRPGCSTHFP